MGETKEAKKGTAQGETMTSGQTSSSKKGSTSGGEPETFTKEQQDKAVSDALSKAGRDAKSLEERGKTLDARDEALKAREAKQKAWEDERDAEEAEAAKSDPERLKAYQDRKSLKTERAKLEEDRATFERDKLQHAELIKAATETEKEIAIWEIAIDYGLDAIELKGRCEELEAETREQMELVAFKKKREEGESPQTSLRHVDSGKTIGGGMTLEQVRAAYAKGEMNTKEYEDRMRDFGLNP